MNRIPRSSIAGLVLALTISSLGCGDNNVFDPTFGTLGLQILTEGNNPDDGYRLLVNGPALNIDREVAAEETVILAVVEAGDYVVELTDIAANCTVENNPRTVSVVFGATSREILNSVCV